MWVGYERDGVTTPATDRTAGPTVRTAVRADLLAVYQIEQSAFPQPWPYSAFEQFLGEPGFLVAVDGTDPPGTDHVASAGVVGYVVADTVPNHGQPLGHVKDLAVHESRRRSGIGRRLLERAVGVLESVGASPIKLEVRASNDAAISLYREFGFTHQRTVPNYYDDGENALILHR
ncbi:GNAT family N-acetyltransferase [Halapricum sp. CBA1109]|uniref:GNAT family N-acetyltransferase n=1 Tax=Halapricum sp. CBA1109 TaxID=2668068 RepID=UPI0012FC85E7|nr:GNAT family N-acetyltransferase [Halapricum sp. CBA1109]MUV90849.1 GNAT family N-acetyltransferase [Halapricum sp. CBA1109]